MTIAERLVMVRNEHGYTRRRLADELGMPYSTITKYENGQREPGHEYLMIIAKKFGVTIDYILGLETEKAPTPKSEREEEWASLFRRAPEDVQEAMLTLLRSRVDQNP